MSTLDPKKPITSVVNLEALKLLTTAPKLQQLFICILLVLQLVSVAIDVTAQLKNVLIAPQDVDQVSSPSV